MAATPIQAGPCLLFLRPSLLWRHPSLLRKRLNSWLLCLARAVISSVGDERYGRSFQLLWYSQHGCTCPEDPAAAKLDCRRTMDWFFRRCTSASASPNERDVTSCWRLLVSMYPKLFRRSSICPSHMRLPKERWKRTGIHPRHVYFHRACFKHSLGVPLGSV